MEEIQTGDGETDSSAAVQAGHLRRCIKEHGGRAGPETQISKQEFRRSGWQPEESRREEWGERLALNFNWSAMKDFTV